MCQRGLHGKSLQFATVVDRPEAAAALRAPWDILSSKLEKLCTTLSFEL